MKILVSLFLFLSLTTFGQTNFPHDWLGVYEGEIELGSFNRDSDTIPIEFEFLEIEKDSIWSYKVTFISEKWGTIVKDYVIRSVSKDNKTDFLFDEQNGIVMEMTFINSGLHGMYEVMGNSYITSLRKIGDQLLFELVMTSKEEPYVTGTEATEEEEAIESKSFKPIIVQTAWFTLK